MRGGAVHHSSVKQTWQTPGSFLDVVRQVGPIGLDPCTVRSNPTGAEVFYTPKLNGLVLPWWPYAFGERIAFANPPYGDACARWVDKAIAEADMGAQIVMLTAARPDTRWGQRLLATCDAACWWRGRLRFRGADHAAPFPSLVTCFNVKRRFIDVFGSHGEITRKVLA